ncbi:hypothetical protein GCM10009716_32620 [Streptomyces sodiiphilus]|uniref:Uncharacterized protein n=1 Tax=Streptomyces sodiiphilus TaxID=226217 RepID=A0ABN2PK60_9ACTN
MFTFPSVSLAVRCSGPLTDAPHGGPATSCAAGQYGEKCAAYRPAPFYGARTTSPPKIREYYASERCRWRSGDAAAWAAPGR